ncbi:hypothetical protein Sjap_015715 [Stephania japonica]|uniref:Uncharacterized protein n=1 Tax=Stephania japonica TaxID=461633 RepID=A0AAP0NRM4_9MAGN
MASQPGLLTEWPWTWLGRFKYVVLAPWAVHSTLSFLAADKNERDLSYFLIFPFLIFRIIHSQLWISFSRYRTASGTNRILDKSIEYDQVDRETNWDDQIILNGLILYLGHTFLDGAKRAPLWRSEGVILVTLLHMGPVEFLYYWLHRALHHHFLYNRYHSHHHSSIVTEPITSVIHPFAEHLMYFTLFAIPLSTLWYTGTLSIVALTGYIIYIDVMNNMGHCNFECVPNWLFHAFPLLKFFIYTPSFHSLHHTQFRTNYSLFMPIYDYIYGTMDKSSDSLYEKSLRRGEEYPDVVYLTHPTTPDSIYHLRIAFASVAASPYYSSNHKLYHKMLMPLMRWLSLLISALFNDPIVVERNMLNQLRMQTWVVPRYSHQYGRPYERKVINQLIERAIFKAQNSGVKVLSLGLLNQDEELNKSGALYVEKHPKMKIRLVDGSSLAVAIVLNSIPKGTNMVVLRGGTCKVALAIVQALCRDGIQVIAVCKSEYEKLRSRLCSDSSNNLVSSSNHSPTVWLVGNGLVEEEQRKAAKGTLFIPFSQLPPPSWKRRKDCIYHSTPAMVIPKALENMDSCENWLARRVMSASRVAGIVHALEGWKEQECGDTMLEVTKVWDAALRHGFRPLN